VPEPTQKTAEILREATQCPTCGLRFGQDALFCPFDGVKLGPATYDPLRDALLGTTIEGRYEVLELLGEGGTGRVYKVRHAALGRLFAMKILRHDLARDEVIAARFIQEARATARVRHPHIIEITDYGNLSEGIPFFVTELLVGQTLRGVIKIEGPIPLLRAMEIVKQIAGALGAAHAVGIIHRDLKPDNIFLVGDGLAAIDVRVVDFGAAKVAGASRMTRDGIVYGTPHYMSPEQASGQPVDHRSDIYSLGIIMYEMFTGRVPFEADTYMGVLTQHMFVQPVPPSRVMGASAELGALEEIALVCLAKGPEDRYPSMQALSAEIERTASGDGQVPPSHIHRRRLDLGVASGGGVPTMGSVASSGVLDPSPQGGIPAELEPLALPKRTIPLRWLVGGAVVFGAVVGVVTWVGGHTIRETTHGTELAASAGSRPVAPSPPVVPPTSEASSSAPSRATDGVSDSTAVASPTTSASPSSGYRPPAPRRAPRPIKIDEVGDPFTVRR
jgi:serine/threonine-protein kinase